MSTTCSSNGRHIIIGEPELHLSLNATSLANARTLGFQKFDATEKLAIEIETEVKKKMRPCRGLKQTVKTSNRKFDLTYKTTLGSLGVAELGLLYHAAGRGGDTARTALANVAGSAFNFDTGAGGVASRKGVGMQLLDAAGTAVHDLDAVLVTGGNAVYGAGQNDATLVEGIDFEVDLKLGYIYFAEAIDDDVISVALTAPAITQNTVLGYMQKMKPGSKFTHRGFGNLYCFDDDEEDNLAFKHEGFQFELTATSGPTLGDDEFGEVEVELTIISPQRSSLYARPGVDAWGAVIG